MRHQPHTLQWPLRSVVCWPSLCCGRSSKLRQGQESGPGTSSGFSAPPLGWLSPHQTRVMKMTFPSPGATQCSSMVVHPFPTKKVSWSSPLPSFTNRKKHQTCTDPDAI